MNPIRIVVIFTLSVVVALISACGGGAGDRGGVTGGGASLKSGKYTGDYTLSTVCLGWLDLDLSDPAHCQWHWGTGLCTPSSLDGTCVQTSGSLILYTAKQGQPVQYKSFGCEMSGDKILLHETGSVETIELHPGP